MVLDAVALDLYESVDFQSAEQALSRYFVSTVVSAAVRYGVMFSTTRVTIAVAMSAGCRGTDGVSGNAGAAGGAGSDIIGV